MTDWVEAAISKVFGAAFYKKRQSRTEYKTACGFGEVVREKRS
ncbi:hypothetical protein [Millionella massiliensis]|nr:hypothetical protein [Millionella massiliensis]